MNKTKPASAFVASLATSIFLISAPIPTALAAEGSGSDFAFNEMILEMSGQDTASQWFDYYVETINQEIAREFLSGLGLQIEIAANGREALEKLNAS